MEKGSSQYMFFGFCWGDFWEDGASGIVQKLWENKNKKGELNFLLHSSIFFEECYSIFNI
jgi:hypothetical protein